MRDRVRARLRSLVRRSAWFSEIPIACAVLCNFLFEAATFVTQFVCLFFHVKFLTILASIVGYDFALVRVHHGYSDPSPSIIGPVRGVK